MIDYITIPHKKEISRGYCQCGCEQKTEISKYTQYASNRNSIKGQPLQYLFGHRGLPIEERLWKYIKVNSPVECWPWIGCKDKDGYGKLTYQTKDKHAHRVVYEICIGEIPEDLCVLHQCDNPSCCNPNHLFLGSPIDNAIDRDNKGRQAKGTSCHTSKLSESDVIEIRQRYISITPNKTQLAKEYNVSQTTIDFLVRRITWKHI